MKENYKYDYDENSLRSRTAYYLLIILLPTYALTLIGAIIWGMICIWPFIVEFLQAVD